MPLSRYSVREFNLSRIEPPNGPDVAAWLNADRAPVDLEIGCGVGWHPIQYAKNHPHRRLIAIEHTRAKFERFASRLEKHPDLANLLAVHADAIRWVAHRLPPESIEHVFFLYPNPEPKAPNRRWLRSPFLHCLLPKLKPGGRITLASNEKWYIDEAREWAENAWGLREMETRSFSGGQPRTHFEKKYLARGQTCFDVNWMKPLK